MRTKSALTLLVVVLAIAFVAIHIKNEVTKINSDTNNITLGLKGGVINTSQWNITINTPITNASEFKRNYNVTITPDKSFNIVDYSHTNTIKNQLTDTVVTNFLNNKKGINKSLFSKQMFLDELQKQNPTNTTQVAMSLKSGFTEGGKYTIKITRKLSGVYAYLLKPPSYEATYTAVTLTNSDRANDNPQIMANNFMEGVVSKVYNEIGAKEQNKQLTTCPFTFNENRGKFYVNIKNEQFYTGLLLCSLEDKLNFTGEQLTIEIYTPNLEDGKAAFRAALAKDGFNESDKLRVVYIHKPGGGK